MQQKNIYPTQGSLNSGSGGGGGASSQQILRSQVSTLEEIAEHFSAAMAFIPFEKVGMTKKQGLVAMVVILLIIILTIRKVTRRRSVVRNRDFFR
jgi:hypothetical protein